jgi:hypothetical protein
MAESTGDILERIWSLQVISLEEAISSRGALGPIANLIIIQIDGLQSHNGVVLVDPDIDANYQRLSICGPLPLILEGTFPTDAPSLLLDTCEGTAPFLRL